MNATNSPAPLPGLPTASVQAQPSTDAAAAEKAAAEKAAAEKAAAEKAKKPPRPRRGPPAGGEDEARVTVIMSTSRMSGATGRLRRGQAASVPERRLEALEKTGKVRQATDVEIASATARFGLGRLG